MFAAPWGDSGSFRARDRGRRKSQAFFAGGRASAGVAAAAAALVRDAASSAALPSAAAAAASSSGPGTSMDRVAVPGATPLASPSPLAFSP